MRALLLISLVANCAATAQPRQEASLLSGPTEIRAELLGANEIGAQLMGVTRTRGTDPAAEGMASGQRDVRRSIPLAFGLSAMIPGAGQAYNRQWKKALVAIGTEAAVMTIWSVTRSRGLTAEDNFRAFANAQWDAGRYATWLNDYVSFLEADFGLSVTAPPANIPSGVDFSEPGSWSSQQVAAVATFFDEIRALERQVFHPETGATFSHQLPGFGEQQYYELIGKYFQFAPGWADYPDWIDGSGAFTAAIDPERTGEGGSKPNVSPTFFDYAKDHAAAQDLLRTASRLSTLFIVNHLVAAIDAAVTAKMRNDRIDTGLGLTYGADGRPTPVAVVRFSF
jgi:hypothetical protein